MEDISETYWQKLAQSRIYFGHQSVGENILEGVNDILSTRRAIALRIVQGTSPDDLDPPAFLHSTIGRNGDPFSKIDAFQRVLEAAIGEKADIAMVKFCFVDIAENTDVSSLFRYYRERMEFLKKKFPNLRIVHVTVPLMTIPGGMINEGKRLIKCLLGKSDERSQSNQKRIQYNDLLVNEYGGNEPLFDLALLESTYPDGSRCARHYGSAKIYSLAPEYTPDGGHLNADGRKKAAEQLLIVLAETAAAQSSR